MGLSYWFNRIVYEIRKKTFFYKRKFSIESNTPAVVYLQDWIQTNNFFFDSKSSLVIAKNKNPVLREKAERILSGNIQFFNGAYFPLGEKYNWLTDPTDGYIYDGTKHWTKINDFSAGRDIKYVWEKSRFCYLYTIVRYDYHFDIDCSDFVIKEMLSWIDHAPFNCGPHYISSQEIGLRIMNWCFFLTYYKNATALTEPAFRKIMQSIQQQAIHIDNTLEFSQKFVRNNHILTEAAALFTVSVLFPSLPESPKWRKKSLRIFEKEIKYQIYKDGTYLQYSTNYNRVVVQLLSWVIGLCKKNQIALSENVFEKGRKTIAFLFSVMQKDSGYLPNYGNNDGSLFFPLNDHAYRDFRPQLQALSIQLHAGLGFDQVFEDAAWFIPEITSPEKINQQQTATGGFEEGGYYFHRDQKTFTFIRCGNHSHRPSQADNLHLDLWFGKENIMRDAGTFQYNGEQQINSFYFGTQSHNTVQIGQLDQMLKGGRFIWYYWTNRKHAAINESETKWNFSGSIKAFRQTGKWVEYKREVTKEKNKTIWVIDDFISGHTGLPLTQIWNPSPYFYDHFDISSFDENGNRIDPAYQQGYFSDTYGMKEEIKQIRYTTNGRQIKTIISLRGE